MKSLFQVVSKVMILILCVIFFGVSISVGKSALAANVSTPTHEWAVDFPTTISTSYPVMDYFVHVDASRDTVYIPTWTDNSNDIRNMPRSFISAYSLKGIQKWKMLFDPYVTQVKLANNGKLMVVNGSTLTALDSNGNVSWRFTTDPDKDRYIRIMGIGDDNVSYIRTSYDDGRRLMNTLYAIDSNGNKLWEYYMGSRAAVKIVPGSNLIVFTTIPLEGDRLLTVTAIDLQGQFKWSYQSQEVVSVVNDDDIGIDENGTIYVRTVPSNGKLYALNQDGSLKWVYSSPDQWYMLNVTNKVYIGMYTGGWNVARLDNQGKVMWERKGDAWYQGSDGTVFVTGADSSDGLAAINPDGSMKWKLSGSYTLKKEYLDSNNEFIYAYDNSNKKFIKIDKSGSVIWGIESLSSGTYPMPSFFEDKYLAFYENNDQRFHFMNISNYQGIHLDATAPTITVSDSNSITVYLGSTYTDAGATATDNVDGDVTSSIITTGTVDTTKEGTYSITYSVQDHAGNTAIATRTVQVINVYKFSGILKPINLDGSSVFKQGSTVPVKFQLTDALNQYVSNLSASIKVAYLSVDVDGTDIEDVISTDALRGTLFRYDSTANQYIFNLSTKGLEAGKYQVEVVLPSTYTLVSTTPLKITFSLRSK